MPMQCLITFDNNPEKVFYGGQLLNGCVELMVTKPRTVKSIRVEIVGFASCFWTEGGGENREYFAGYESYLDETNYLIGDKNEQCTYTTLQPGRQCHSFECQLPDRLPTSFEGKEGFIRYEVTVIIEYPDHYSNYYRNCFYSPSKTFKELFTIINPLDLNRHQELRDPVILETQKRFNSYCIFYCCRSGPMYLTAQIPMRGFTPGQKIDVKIDINNESIKNVKFSIQLIQQFILLPTSHLGTEKIESTLVCENKCIGLCKTNDSETFNASLIIPPTPPTDDVICAVCRRRYILRIIGRVSGCHKNSRLDIPVTIGVYPFSRGSSKRGSRSFGDGLTVPFSQEASTTTDPLLPRNGTKVTYRAKHPTDPDDSTARSKVLLLTTTSLRPRKTGAPRLRDG